MSPLIISVIRLSTNTYHLFLDVWHKSQCQKSQKTQIVRCKKVYGFLLSATVRWIQVYMLFYYWLYEVLLTLKLSK
jgi:hypothetical protein